MQPYCENCHMDGVWNTNECVCPQCHTVIARLRTDKEEIKRLTEINEYLLNRVSKYIEMLEERDERIFGLEQELEEVKEKCSELVWNIRPNERHYEELKEFKLKVVRDNEILIDALERIRKDLGYEGYANEIAIQALVKVMPTND